MSLDKLRTTLAKKSSEHIPLDTIEEQELIKDFQKSKIMTFQRLLAETERKPSYFPQPVRTQPNLEVFQEHPEWPLSVRMAKATAADVKKWGPKIVADIKYDGVRGLLYVNPKTKTVKMYSRRLKELNKLEDKYATAILDNVSNLVSDETVFDAELYATGSEGKLLPYGTVEGWARNPNSEEYKDIVPTIEAFDMVLMNKHDIRDVPLKYRKRLLEASVKRLDGVVLDVADTRLMKNHPRPIEWRFKAIIRGKGEGLVLKDPGSEYFYGKLHPSTNPWRKLKAVDTLDLELKAVEASPYGKEFENYRHWIMVPSDDNTHEVKANKGIQRAQLDNKFYNNFSLDMINKWKLGKLKAEGEMIPVSESLRKFYGVRMVPTKLVYPKTKRTIVELFIEKISKNYQPSGTKIVGIRTDKTIGDTMKDVVDLANFLVGNVK